MVRPKPPSGPEAVLEGPRARLSRDDEEARGVYTEAIFCKLHLLSSDVTNVMTFPLLFVIRFALFIFPKIIRIFLAC